MITYRNELWEPFLKFVEVFQNYKPFETYENGRYKKRISTIYNKMLKKCYIRQGDIDLVTATMMFVNEKDVSSEMTEIMDLAEKYNIECLTTKDGEEIFKKAEKEYKEMKATAAITRKIEEKRIELETAKIKHEKYLEEKERTKNDVGVKTLELRKLNRDLKKIALQENETVEEIEKTDNKINNFKNKLKEITLEDSKTQKEPEVVNV